MNKKLLWELYVELTTRKLAIDYNDEDCLYEVYNSWFAFFSFCREQMKKCVPERVRIDRVGGDSFFQQEQDQSLKFYQKSMSIIRPHLEKYSYDYRCYWENSANSIQEDYGVAIIHKPLKGSQKNYVHYKEIIEDIKNINNQFQNMVNEILDQAGI